MERTGSNVESIPRSNIPGLTVGFHNASSLQEEVHLFPVRMGVTLRATARIDNGYPGLDFSRGAILRIEQHENVPADFISLLAEQGGERAAASFCLELTGLDEFPFDCVHLMLLDRYKKLDK